MGPEKEGDLWEADRYKRMGLHGRGEGSKSQRGKNASCTEDKVKENTGASITMAKEPQPLSGKTGVAELESTYISQQQTKVSLQDRRSLYTVVLKEITHKIEGLGRKCLK